MNESPINQLDAQVAVVIDEINKLTPILDAMPLDTRQKIIAMKIIAGTAFDLVLLVEEVS